MSPAQKVIEAARRVREATETSQQLCAIFSALRLAEKVIGRFVELVPPELVPAYITADAEVRQALHFLVLAPSCPSSPDELLELQVGGADEEQAVASLSELSLTVMQKLNEIVLTLTDAQDQLACGEAALHVGRLYAAIAPGSGDGDLR